MAEEVGGGGEDGQGERGGEQDAAVGEGFGDRVFLGEDEGWWVAVDPGRAVRG
ncbi:hypothetical protein GXW83_32765 [Streptacidiphilus sp. PB12-B1b]|uniref:hypothetical protein n=1 Tax=Streptacidiphilus sp. PB12-B1b TaxID=2705012 RepID=UPI0015F92D75|nr:hypothetical protein [Streptacidiphilus sp. PB12-B1b]QMU79764.1 hypothetical protein GXW83_32765 [Streptacidiphilus sp. PB12-B1b]